MAIFCLCVIKPHTLFWKEKKTRKTRSNIEQQKNTLQLARILARSHRMQMNRDDPFSPWRASSCCWRAHMVDCWLGEEWHKKTSSHQKKRGHKKNGDVNKRGALFSWLTPLLYTVFFLPLSRLSVCISNLCIQTYITYNMRICLYVGLPAYTMMMTTTTTATYGNVFFFSHFGVFLCVRYLCRSRRL